MAKDVRAHVPGDPRPVGHGPDDVLGPPNLDRERLLQGEVLLHERSHAGRHGHDADLGPLAVSCPETEDMVCGNRGRSYFTCPVAKAGAIQAV
jgi:hypothetical protein